MVHKTKFVLHGEWLHHLTVKELMTLKQAEQLWGEAKDDPNVPKQTTDRGVRIALRVGSVALGESKMTRALEVRTERDIKDPEEHTRCLRKVGAFSKKLKSTSLQFDSFGGGPCAPLGPCRK